MKLKRSTISSQILILMMAAVVLLIMVQVAQADSSRGKLAQSSGGQGSHQNQAQVLQIGIPQKSLGRRLLENTTLGYYQQFLGPTAAGSGSETYNVFQEAIDTPGSGRAPLQSFHAMNLRHQITTDWAAGVTLSAVNGYTDEVQTRDRNNAPVTNNGQWDFFNARAYVTLPALRFSPGTLFTTVSYEHPTSSISKADNMKWGWVVAQSFAFNLPNIKWTAGLTGQVYRLYYNTNVKAPPFSPALGGRPTPLQTMIVSGGPYVNYRFNDRWQMGSLLTFDWDQRGLQSGSRDFNNNLSDRARVSLSYFPQKLKYLQSVGLFSQALLKFRPETTAFGADLALRF